MFGKAFQATSPISGQAFDFPCFSCHVVQPVEICKALHFAYNVNFQSFQCRCGEDCRECSYSSKEKVRWVFWSCLESHCKEWTVLHKLKRSNLYIINVTFTLTAFSTRAGVFSLHLENQYIHIQELGQWESLQWKVVSWSSSPLNLPTPWDLCLV